MAQAIDILPGTRFGKLTVIKFYKSINKVRHYFCKCDCGNEKAISVHNLKRGLSKSCGCSKKVSPRRIELSAGTRFGKLTVIERHPSTKGRSIWYLCRCDCGNETVLPGSSLKSGHTKSCGCLQYQYIEILSGTRFGKLTVIEPTDSTKHGKRRYLCKCDCGNETKVVDSNLLNGHTKSCGCSRHEIPLNFIDLTGKRFGRLVVTERKEGSKKIVYLKCKCDCGNIVFVGGKELRNGHTKSCGCYNKEKRYKPEGVASFNRLFGAYKRNAKIKGREFSLSAEEFEKLTSDNCFYCGAAPSSVMINKNGNGDFIYNGIDRVDNSKGYLPGNCVTCCTVCNLAKRERPKKNFMHGLKEFTLIQF